MRADHAEDQDPPWPLGPNDRDDDDDEEEDEAEIGDEDEERGVVFD